MWLNDLFHRFMNRRAGRLAPSPRRSCRLRVRPRLEQLEDRSLLSSYTAANVTDLMADIRAANKHGGANTIVLAVNTTFDLTKVDNKTDGPTGLPVISAGNNLTISGNGDMIERGAGAPAFRLFDVAVGAALTLQNLTLQNGLALGSAAKGGAIENQGTLLLSGVVVQDSSAWGNSGAPATKKAVGGAGSPAYGGGIWSNGTLTLENDTRIENNGAYGGAGGQGILTTIDGYKFYAKGGSGASGFGGGVFVAGGTVNASNITLSGNQAVGGAAGRGGPLDGTGFGGGLFVGAGAVSLTDSVIRNNKAQEPFRLDGFGGGLCLSGGTVSLLNDTVESNTATGDGGLGGGIYISSGATAYIDSFTIAHTLDNTDGSGLNGSTANILGPYTAT